MEAGGKGEKQQGHGACLIWAGGCGSAAFRGPGLDAQPGSSAGEGEVGTHCCLRCPCPPWHWKGGGNYSVNGERMGVGAGASSFSAAAHPPGSMMLVHPC